jgi:hypothetical protein
LKHLRHVARAPLINGGGCQPTHCVDCQTFCHCPAWEAGTHLMLPAGSMLAIWARPRLFRLQPVPIRDKVRSPCVPRQPPATAALLASKSCCTRPRCWATMAVILCLRGGR